jgi:predicted RNA-binding Zn-ribbon protein involved in translation (DUF1610 family)
MPGDEPPATDAHASRFICPACGAEPWPIRWEPLPDDGKRRAVGREDRYKCPECGLIGFREAFDGQAAYYDHLLGLDHDRPPARFWLAPWDLIHPHAGPPPDPEAPPHAPPKRRRWQRR